MNTSTSKEHPMAGQLAVLATAVLLSTAGLTIKLVPWHPFAITGMRSIVATIFLLVLRFVSPPPKNVKSRPLPLAAAAFTFAFMMMSFVAANKITTAANAVLLMYGAPIWAALLGWWLIKEKPNWEHWGALVLIFGGMFLFLKDGLGGGALAGDSLAILAGVFYGAHSVFMRMLKDGNLRDAMLLAHVICLIIGLPFIILHPPVFTVKATLAVTYMGLFQIGLASLCLAYGLKRVRAVQAMLISTAEPVLNPVWVLIATGEKPTPVALAGGAIIIFAVVVSSLIGKRRDDDAKVKTTDPA